MNQSSASTQFQIQILVPAVSSQIFSRSNPTFSFSSNYWSKSSIHCCDGRQEEKSSWGYPTPPRQRIKVDSWVLRNSEEVWVKSHHFWYRKEHQLQSGDALRWYHCTLLDPNNNNPYKHRPIDKFHNGISQNEKRVAETLINSESFQKWNRKASKFHRWEKHGTEFIQPSSTL